MSFVAETFIFLYVGMDALDIEKWRFVSERYADYIQTREYISNDPSEYLPLEIIRATHLQYFFFSYSLNWVLCSPGTSVAVSSTLLCLVLLGRAAFVFPLSFLINLTKKSRNEHITFGQQVSSCLYLSLITIPNY